MGLCISIEKIKKEFPKKKIYQATKNIPYGKKKILAKKGQFFVEASGYINGIDSVRYQKNIILRKVYINSKCKIKSKKYTTSVPVNTVEFIV